MPIGTDPHPGLRWRPTSFLKRLVEELLRGRDSYLSGALETLEIAEFEQLLLHDPAAPQRLAQLSLLEHMLIDAGHEVEAVFQKGPLEDKVCLLYTSPSPRDFSCNRVWRIVV